jgi:hypothetical protein
MRQESGNGPEFSILLPTHNRADVLPFAIRSVLGQTLQDFELLVVGDGCTDNTADIVKGINDPRIIWFDLPKAPNFGYANRNIALRQARGRYIAFMPHDDLWLPDHLEMLRPFLEQPGVEIAYSRPLWVIPEGMIAPAMFNLEHAPTLELFLAKKRNRIPAGCVVHRHECFLKYGYWNEALLAGGDWDMWARIVQGGERTNFAQLSEPTCLHFHANWRKENNFMLEHEIVWEHLHALDGFLPAPLKISVPDGITEQDAIWQAMSVDPLEWSKRFRAAIRQALDLRISQSDELIAWLLKRWPLLACDAAGLIDLVDGLLERKASWEITISSMTQSNAGLTALAAELAEIKTSKAWKLALFFRRIRLLLAPPRSHKPRVLQSDDNDTTEG